MANKVAFCLEWLVTRREGGWDRAAMGTEERKVCVISSAWESTKKPHSCSQRALRVPCLPPSLLQAKQSARCVEIRPLCQDVQLCRQGPGWGWLGAAAAEEGAAA